MRHAVGAWRVTNAETGGRLKAKAGDGRVQAELERACHPPYSGKPTPDHDIPPSHQIRTDARN